jgi:Tfp pilus assembly protein PilO
MNDTRRILFEHRRAVWLIVGLLLLNAALFALVVYPLSRKVDGGEAAAQAAATELAAATRDEANAQATVTGKGQADAELQKFYHDVLPPDQSGARRIMYLRILQLAEQFNLAPPRYSVDPNEQRRNTDLRKLSMTLTVSGDYANIRRFIHALESAPEFLVLENVALTQGESGSRTLQVTALVSTYYRTGGDGA